ncbi:PIN-like domain-containing protein [Brevibacillus reuszeri]|uniref:PIN-like domain-containing protein n=1 Tax=Brevibacillus reuszeri TaxID=54915 RepID=UPI003670C267
MKELFSMYYLPDKKEFDRIWNECVFVFDANVLLNLYRYSIKTTELFIRIIESLEERVWLPHQVALEYHANRTTVIYEQSDAYNSVRNTISNASNDLFKRLDEDLKSYKRRHPVIEVNAITKRIEAFLTSINEELEKQEKGHPNYIHNDSIRASLEKTFLGKIGETYTEEEYKKIFEDGEKRYKQKRPPGYKDAADKKNKQKYYRGLVIEDQYGDLIVWKQIMDKAKNEKKPIIFVTDDAKDDWWQKDHGKTIGPRVELTDEFAHNTSQAFYMYESYRFMEYAQNYLKQKIDKEAIQEVQELKLSMEEINDLEEELQEWINKNTSSRNKGFKLKRKEKLPDYRVGDKVKHVKWGIGTCVKVSDEGKMQEVDVAFPSPVGIKKLLAYYAPIEKVGQIRDANL